MEAAHPGEESGILHTAASRRHFTYARHDPDPRLAPWVLNFWTVTWDLGEPFTAQVLPFPSVNLSVTNTEADVTGLVRRRYDRHLVGRGYVVGARFRPACFRPFLGSSVSALTGTRRSIADVLGRPTGELFAAVAATDDSSQRVQTLTEFLNVDLPEPDPTAWWLADLVGQIAARADLVRVDQVAELAGLSVRQLQRLFADYVGAGPKWVIGRSRLRRAVVETSGSRERLADLATELGYADQAHLTRTFSSTVGVPPGLYARNVEEPG